MNEFDRIVAEKRAQELRELQRPRPDQGYIDDGKLSLILHSDCDLDALEKLHRFVTNLIAQRR